MIFCDGMTGAPLRARSMGRQTGAEAVTGFHLRQQTACLPPTLVFVWPPEMDLVQTGQHDDSTTSRCLVG